MASFFYNIYLLIQKHKRIAFALIILLLGLFSLLSSQLKFEEDITKLIPENEEAVLLNKVLKQVDFADKIVILIRTEENGDINDITKLATQVTDSLKNGYDDYILEVQGLIDEDEFEATIDFVYDNLPLFLNEKDYLSISKKLTPEALDKKVKEVYKTLVSPTGIIAKQTLLKDPLGISFLGLDKLKDLQVADNFIIKNGFIVTKDEKNILLFIKPKLASNETAKNTQFVDQLHQLEKDFNLEFKSKAILNFYGATVVAVANANQIKNDIHTTVGIAMAVLFLILILFYKKITIPLILFLPTIFGALIAIATLYLFRGTISAISIGIGSLLLGITLDYSLHVLTHYRNNSNEKELYKDVAKPIVMSSITTALAFLCLLFIKSRALQDLGVFAAVSVLGSSFFALILIPHLYKSSGKTVKKSNIIDRFSEFSFAKSKLLIAVCMLLFIVSIFTYNRVVFEKDISKMNFQTEELLEIESNLNGLLNNESKSLYIIAHGNSLKEALHVNNSVYKQLSELKSEQKIINFTSVSAVILNENQQLSKIKNWNNFWNSPQQDHLKKI